MIPVGNEGVDGAIELFGATERCVFQCCPTENAEPDLDLVDPRRVQWRMQEMKPSTMLPIKLIPSFTVMDIQVIPNNVDRSFWDMIRDLGHELQKAIGSASSNAANDLARLNIEGCKQGARSMASVFKVDAGLSSANMGWSNTLQRLNPRFLVDTQHSGTGWGRKIESTDSFNFGSKFWILTL